MKAVLPLTIVICIACGAWLLELPFAVRAGLFMFLLIGGLWLSESFHLTVTALLVPLLAIGFGLMPVPQALGYFASPVIAIFFGGFALASALRAQGLDAWLAHGLLRLAGGRSAPGILLLFAATLLVGLWISNTATATLMLPLALGLLHRHAEDTRLRTFVLLGVAWSATLGGMIMLIGSPPNAIAAQALGWGFRDWLSVGLPVFALLYPLALAVLWTVLRPQLPARLASPPAADDGDAGFQWNRTRVLTLGIFVATAGLWIFGDALARTLGIGPGVNKDAAIAVLAAVALCIARCTDWQRLSSDVNWGVLLLFGGGLALSGALEASGASLWLAEQLGALLPTERFWLTLFIVTLAVVLFSEFISNTACAALLIPLFIPMAPAIGLPVEALVPLIAIASSTAFMLPVATPPNALVYGTGLIASRDMRRAGLAMNLSCVIPLVLFFGSKAG